MNDGEDDSDDERAMLKATPSGPRSTLSRRSKSVAKTYHENDSSSDEPADPAGNTGAVTPTPKTGGEQQQDFFAGGAFDGAGEGVVHMNGVASLVDVNGVVTGTLAPQGKTINGNGQAKAPTNKRAIKREKSVDDSDGSDFQPDFMKG
jgi:hypothetical protein